MYIQKRVELWVDKKGFYFNPNQCSQKYSHVGSLHEHDLRNQTWIQVDLIQLRSKSIECENTICSDPPR